MSRGALFRSAPSRSALVTLALTAALLGTLSGCSSDDTGPDSTDRRDASTSPPSGTPTPTTAAPTQVSFGDEQLVAWAPTESVTGELSIRVDAVRRGRPADFAGLVAAGISKDNQAYYVDVALTHEGGAELGGLDVPLYLLDSRETLTPPSRFAEPFRPCDSGPLPESFASGDEVETCLVFVVAPGAALESITFRPALDGPAVSWTGEVDPPTRPRR